MKKLFALICVGLMICTFAMAEETEEYVPRGKSIGIEREEWIERYEAVPKMFVKNDTPVYFVNAGTADDRLVYYANPIDHVNFSVLCEDTTEEVFAILIQIDFTAVEDDFSVGKKIGGFIAESFVRMVYATTPDITPDDLENAMALLDPLANGDMSDYSNSIDIENVRYVCTITNGILTYGLRSVDVFASEEEFQKYREETKQ